MNLAIIGPGSIGLLLAGYFLKTRAKLNLVHHHFDRMLELNQGIRWEGLDGDLNFTLPISLKLEKPDKTELVIVCVKAYQTESVARHLREVGYRGAVLTLQNGLNNTDILREILPDCPLMAGITTEGAYRLGVNQVRHAGKGKTSFGPITPGFPTDGFVQELVSLFREAGLDAELSDNPLALVWNKALVNAAINPLTAIVGVPNGSLLDIESARKLMVELVVEGREVMKRKQIPLAYRDPVARIEEVCRSTGGNYSSMYMDIKEGRRTEIDFINGAIVREGARLGLSCPYNDAVASLVRAMEQKKTTHRRTP